MLTRAEWESMLKMNGGDNGYGKKNFKFNKAKVYNCHDYGHFSKELRKPEKEGNVEVHLAQACAKDEPALL